MRRRGAGRHRWKQGAGRYGPGRSQRRWFKARPLVGLWAEAAPGGGLATSRPGLFPLPGPEREGSRPGRPWRSLPSWPQAGARGEEPKASRGARASVRSPAARRPSLASCALPPGRDRPRAPRSPRDRETAASQSLGPAGRGDNGARPREPGIAQARPCDPEPPTVLFSGPLRLTKRTHWPSFGSGADLSEQLAGA